MAAPTQSFADKFRSSSKTRFRDEYRVDLRKDGFTGASAIGPSVSDIRIDYGARRLETGLIPSAARITFLDRNHLYGTELALSEPRDWQLRIYQGTDLIWEGYVLPENLDENLSELDEYLTIEATDGTAYLNDYIYDGPAEGRVSIAKLIYDAFAQISPQTTVRINNLLTPYAATPLTGNETLSSQYVDVSLLVGKTWYQVLVDDILNRFGLAACYMDGGFIVFDVHSVAASSYSLDHVDSDGAKTGDTVTVSSIEEETYSIGRGAKLQGKQAAQRVSVHWDRGYASDLLTYTPNGMVADGWQTDTGRNTHDPFPTVAGTLRFEDNGLSTLSGAAWQETEFRTGAEVFGIRFAGNVGHTADDPTVVSSFTNGMSAWGLSHTTSAGVRLWYNHTSEEWQEAQIRNSIVASFPTGQAFDWTLPDPGESGTLRLTLFGGTSTVTTDRQTAIYLEWIGVHLHSVVAEEGQRLLFTTFAQNTDAKAGELLDVPGANDDFTYGSLFITDTNEYPSAITLNADGDELARGYKIGLYNAGETPDYTNDLLTIDSELARHQLMLRSDHVKIWRTELLLSEATVLAPGRGIVYAGETYMAREIINNIKDRTARIIAVRVNPQEPDNVSIEVLKIAEDVRNRSRLERRNAQLLPSRGTGVLTRQGTGDDTGDDPGTYDVVQYGTDGQVFSVVDGVPQFTDPGGVPDYDVTQAGLVLKVNSMGNLVWATDEIGSAGSVLPPKAGHEGKVLKIVSDTVGWHADNDTMYSAGEGLGLTTAGVFSVVNPLPAVDMDDIGKILKVNADGTGYLLGDDANTTYTAGNGLALTGTSFAVDFPNNGGLQFNNSKLRVKIANGISRSASGIGVKLNGSSLTVGSAGLSVTRPLSAADRTLLDSGIEAGATIDQTGPEIVALLTALAGNNRLDASAIKGLTDNNDNDFVTAGALTNGSLALTIPNQTTVTVGGFITTAERTAIGRIPTASPGNNKVWKTNGSGVADWRDDATGSGGDGNDYVTAGTYSGGSLTLTVSNQDDVVVTGFPTGFAASAITGLATVATTGSYNDLDDLPTLPTDTNDYVTAGTYASGTITLTVSNQDDVSITGLPTNTITAGERTSLGRIPTVPTNSEGGKVWKTDADGNPAWRDDEVGTPGTGEANVQVDWAVTDDTSDTFILNKPTAAIGRIPKASPGNSKVWKTNGSGVADWRDDADTTYTAGAGLSLSAGNEFSVDNPISAAAIGRIPTANPGAGKVWKTDADGDPDWRDDDTGTAADGNDFVTAGSYSSGTITLTIPNQTNVSITGIPQGDITGVTAGNGLTGGGTSGDVTLAVGEGAGMTVNANNVAVTHPLPLAFPAVTEAKAGQFLTIVDSDPENTGTEPALGWANVPTAYTWTFGGTTIASGDAILVDSVGLEWDATNKTLKHKDTSSLDGAQAGTQGQFVSGFTVDENGHLTNVSYSTPTDTDNDTTYTAGDGLNLSVTAFSVKLQNQGGLGFDMTSRGLKVDRPIPTFAEADHGKVLMVNDPDPDTMGSMPITMAWTSLGAAALSNSYNDLDNLPSIPAALSDLTGTVTDAQIPAGITRDSELHAVATSGMYSDLAGTPTIPDATTGVFPISVTDGAVSLLGFNSTYTVASTTPGAEVESGVWVIERAHTGSGAGYSVKKIPVSSSGRVLSTRSTLVDGTKIKYEFFWTGLPSVGVQQLAGGDGLVTRTARGTGMPTQGEIVMNIDIHSQSGLTFTTENSRSKLDLDAGQKIPDFGATNVGQVLQVAAKAGTNPVEYEMVWATGSGGGGGGSGDIESVIAGTGLTGGATTGNATLNVGQGAGITVNANDVAVTNPLPPFTSATDGQVLQVSVSGSTRTLGWATVSGGGGGTADSVAWTDITGKPNELDYLDNVTSDLQAQIAALQAAIDAKQNIISGLTGAQKTALREQLGFRRLTQAQFDALDSEDANTVYWIPE